MSPEQKELFDALNEQGLDFDDRDDIEAVEYPDVMANNNNNTIENSETDCESCDGISIPKDSQKKIPDNNEIVNDMMQSIIAIDNEKDAQKTLSYIPVEDITLHKTTASTSGK